MLFDFHQKQNAKRPNSVHATYLITGTKRNTEHTNGANARNVDDVDMRSSPFMSSMPGQDAPEPEPAEESADDSADESSDDSAEELVTTTTIQLVREEELQGVWHLGIGKLRKLTAV
jgi:DNA polymerase delta subunit 3